MRNSNSPASLTPALCLLTSLLSVAARASTIEPPAPAQPTKESPTSTPTPTPATTPATQSPPAQPAAQPIPQPTAKPTPKPIPRTVNKTGNLLLNPDFESPKLADKPDWWSFAQKNTESWVDFTIVPEKGREKDGQKSKAARLLVDSTGRSNKTAISGVVQEVKGDHVPEKLSGWYFVESWDKNTPKLYLQAVVIVWNDFEARQKQLVNAPSIQIAYTFTGVKTAPKNMTNRKFVVLGDETPKQGEWVHFEVNPREDFVKLWNIDPGQFEFIRVFFELRYDDIHETTAANPAAPPTKASAYYDDVYFGD